MLALVHANVLALAFSSPPAPAAHALLRAASRLAASTLGPQHPAAGTLGPQHPAAGTTDPQHLAACNLGPEHPSNSGDCCCTPHFSAAQIHRAPTPSHLLHSLTTHHTHHGRHTYHTHHTHHICSTAPSPPHRAQPCQYI
eukprot:32065-Chlamydomonas_euryale.AAC.2